MTDPPPSTSDPGRLPAIPDHELLRRIGGGSYGEVWMARSATGFYRAVKIIPRARFGDDRQPLEREFEGLVRFESVSRKHEHLVDVLHIGRHDEVLYYVMELADNACEPGIGGPADAVRDYVPDTLSERLRQRGRFPINECIGIARALALALDHLHAHGLIHRDVKPSNVVFVDGVLRLADVGLVSGTDGSLSLVGTEGFIPPEGPGTVQADIYGLGKILYEISSGLDRMEFPSVPEWLGKEADDRAWSEFNEIVLRCCEKDPEHRYPSAGEVLADLDLLERGSSLVRLRRSRQAWRTAKIGAGIAIAAGLLFALGARMDPWRENAPSPAVAPPPPVATMLDLGGLEPPLNLHGHREWDTSSDGKLLAMGKGGGIVIWSRQTGTSVSAVARNPGGWHLWNPRWLVDGRLIVCLGSRPGVGATPDERAVLLINAEDHSVERVVYRTSHILSRMSVSPATRQVAVRALGDGSDPGGLLGIHVDSGAVEVWDRDEGYGVGDFSPDGAWLALYPSMREVGGRMVPQIWLFSPGTGSKVCVTDREGVALQPTWSSDGQGCSLYFVAGRELSKSATLNLWKVGIDPASGRAAGPARQVTSYRDTQVLFPQVVGQAGEILVALERSSLTVWTSDSDAPESAQPLVAAVENPLLTRDGRWVFYGDRRAGREGVYRISTTGRETPLRVVAEVPESIDASPSGADIVLTARSGDRLALKLRNLAGGDERMLADLSGNGGCSVRWSPDGRRIAYTDGGSLFVVEASGGAPRLLGTIDDWMELSWDATLAWSPDSRLIAGLGYPDAPSREAENNHVMVADVSNGSLRSVTGFASDAFYKEGLRWHPDSDRLSYTIYGPETGGSQIRLAYPDGRPTTLLVDQQGGSHWEWIGSWHPGGNEFHFLGVGEGHPPNRLHVLRLDTGEILHASGPLASKTFTTDWSTDGQRRIWSAYNSTRQLWILDEE